MNGCRRYFCHMVATLSGELHKVAHRPFDQAARLAVQRLEDELSPSSIRRQLGSPDCRAGQRGRRRFICITVMKQMRGKMACSTLRQASKKFGSLALQMQVGGAAELVQEQDEAIGRAEPALNAAQVGDELAGGW